MFSSYASSDQKASGKFHRIRVAVSRPGLELRYRRGYYAPREKLSPEDRKNEDIRIALAAPDDFDQIPLELTYESSQAEENRCRVSFFTHIKIYGMPFHRQRERRRNVVHLVVTLYDENEEQAEVVGANHPTQSERIQLSDHAPARTHRQDGGGGSCRPVHGQGCGEGEQPGQDGIAAAGIQDFGSGGRR